MSRGRRKVEVCWRGHPRTPENTYTANGCTSCKACKMITAALRRQNYPEAAKTKSLRDNRKKSARIGAYVVEYKKNHPCVDCGESDYVVLVFDHRDPSKKKFRIRQARSWIALRKEIDKCDVRCCNCHARRHSAHGWKF